MTWFVIGGGIVLVGLLSYGLLLAFAEIASMFDEDM